METLDELQIHSAKYGLLGVYDACEVLGWRIRVANEWYFDIEEADGALHRYKNDETGEKLAWMMLETKLDFLKKGSSYWQEKELPPENWNGRDHGYNWVFGSKGYRCLEHTLSDYYGGSIMRFVAMLTNEDTSFMDVFGCSLDANHDDSIQYHTGPDRDWYPDGVTCEHPGCGAELIEAYEDRQGWDDFEAEEKEEEL